MRSRRTTLHCPPTPQERDLMGPGTTYNNAPDDLLHSLEGPGTDLRW